MAAWRGNAVMHRGRVRRSEARRHPSALRLSLELGLFDYQRQPKGDAIVSNRSSTTPSNAGCTSSADVFDPSTADTDKRTDSDNARTLLELRPLQGMGHPPAIIASMSKVRRTSIANP